MGSSSGEVCGGSAVGVDEPEAERGELEVEAEGEKAVLLGAAETKPDSNVPIIL